MYILCGKLCSLVLRTLGVVRKLLRQGCKAQQHHVTFVRCRLAEHCICAMETIQYAQHAKVVHKSGKQMNKYMLLQMLCNYQHTNFFFL